MNDVASSPCCAAPAGSGSYGFRLRGMSYRTEQTYLDWIKRFIVYHQKRHPREMGSDEIRDVLSYLVLERNVAPSTQNQALHTVLYLYKQVLENDFLSVEMT